MSLCQNVTYVSKNVSICSFWPFNSFWRVAPSPCCLENRCVYDLLFSHNLKVQIGYTERSVKCCKMLPTYLPPVLFDIRAEREEPPLLGTSRPDDWLAARMADLTSLLQVFLSLGSYLASPHEEQSFFSSWGQDILGRPLPLLLQWLWGHICLL